MTTRQTPVTGGIETGELESGKAIDVAGVTLVAEAATDDIVLEQSLGYAAFLVDRPADPDVLIRVHYGPLPEVEGADAPVFDSGGIWRMYHRPQGYALVMTTPVVEGGTYRTVLMDETLSMGDLYVKPLADTDPPGLPVVRPWEYPLAELLVVNQIADGRGVNLHGCATVVDDEGHLFIGVSGAGKSTLALLWKQRGTPVLSDDRLIVRPESGRYSVHGTPWHGDARESRRASAPLAGLYFLNKHADENYLRRLSAADAVTRLLVCCFPTYYFRVGMENTMEIITNLARQVPAFEFGFMPDMSSIDYFLENRPR